MFGRTISIDGTEVFVPCSPRTPYSAVLARASKILAREEMGCTAFSELDAAAWAGERRRAEEMAS